MGIHDQHRGGCRIGPFHGVIQRVFDDKLHLAVDGQIHGGHLDFFPVFFQVRVLVGNGAAHGVHHFCLAHFRAFQNAVQRQFQSGKPAVVRSYKAQHLGCHGFFRIIAFAFGNKMQARQLVFLNNLYDLLVVFRLQHTLDPDKLSFQCKVFIQSLFADVQNRRQFLGCDPGDVPVFCLLFAGFGALVHLIGIHIQGMHHDADRQFFPVPVHDPPPGRMPFDFVCNLYGSPFPQLRAADDLNPQQLDGHGNEHEQNQTAQKQQTVPAVL